MGTEIRRMVVQEAVDCQDKYLWATGALGFLLSLCKGTTYHKYLWIAVTIDRGCLLVSALAVCYLQQLQ